MIAKTKMYEKFQTVVPKKIREKLGITHEHKIIEWNINDKNEVILTFKKKKSIDDLIGKYATSEKFDAVEELKKLRKAELK